jgi:hypothetical protein
VSTIPAWKLIGMIERMHTIKGELQKLLPEWQTFPIWCADFVIGELMAAGMSDVQVEMPTTAQVEELKREAA